MRVLRLAPVGLFAVGLLLAACGGGEGPTNILLVTLDTTRADVLSCYGGKPKTTPAIDALARRGVLFENAYSALNVTKPAHVSILTGARAIQHRVFSNAALIPEDVEPLPLILRDRGYQTGAFVSAVQLGESTGWRGFQHIDGPRAAARDGRPVVDGAARWMREAREPFFLWVHLFEPHTLYTPPEKFAKRFYEGDPKSGDGPLLAKEPFIAGWNYPPMQEWIAGVRDPAWARAMYEAEVAYTDKLVGDLLSALDRSGRLERTGIVLTADHGESLGEHGVYFDHAGLYEASLRIPLVVRWPGTGGGRRVSEIVTQLDILPTLADLVGFGLPQTDGVSLRPLLEGTSGFAEREVHVFESAHNQHIAVRRGRWKAIWPVFEKHRFFAAEPELYDLEADPTETMNVIAEHPDVVSELEPYAAPWRALGVITKGDVPEVSAEVQEMISGLGYAGGDEDGE